MGDYGIRISKTGQDVKSCSDLNTILTSKYPLLKGAIIGSGTIDLTPAAPTYEATGTVTIAHGLGYVAAARMFVMPEYWPTPGPSDHPEWAFSPVGISVDCSVHPSDHYDLDAYHYSDATNLYLVFTVACALSSLWQHMPITLTYKYHIFYDKGKL